MTAYLVKIVCRAKSHEGKEVIAGRLQSDDQREGKAPGAVTLIDDRPVDHRKVWGGINSAPDWELSQAFTESGRTRHEFKCDLCGLRVELTEATATTLMRGLIASGKWTEQHYRPDGVGDESEPFITRVSSVNLESLAASM